MNLKDVVTFIVTDRSVDTAGLNAIISAIKDRQRMNRATQSAVAKATLSVGMTVSISGIRPKYYNGAKGTIVAFNKTRTRADIRITDTNGAYQLSVGQVAHGFPITTLTVVETAPKSVLTEADGDVLRDFMAGL